MAPTNKQLQQISDRLASIDVRLATYNAQLEVHIKRSEMLELELTPVKKHVTAVQTGLRLVAWLVGSGALLALFQALRG